MATVALLLGNAQAWPAIALLGFTPFLVAFGPADAAIVAASAAVFGFAAIALLRRVVDWRILHPINAWKNRTLERRIQRSLAFFQHHQRPFGFLELESSWNRMLKPLEQF